LYVGKVLAVTLPFEDGFENIAVKDYPDENGWQMLFSGKDAYVSDEVVHSGDRAFRLESYPTWSRTDYVLLDEVPDLLSYQMSVYVDLNYPRTARVGFCEAFGNQGPMFNCFSVVNDDGLSGRVDFRGAFGLPGVQLGKFTVGDWVTVRADLDFTSLTAKLWLNGQLLATEVNIDPKEYDHPTWGHVVLNKLGATEYNWSGGGTGVIYIDDVRINETTLPDIKANGSDGPVFVAPGESVDVTISLDPGDKAGIDADWWISAMTHFGTYWYERSQGWRRSDSPICAVQYPLFELPERSLLNIKLPVGIYTFCFILDDTPDRVFDMTWHDYVNVICQGEATIEVIPDFDSIFQQQ
jgi:hypothetical protein